MSELASVETTPQKSAPSLTTQIADKQKKIFALQDSHLDSITINQQFQGRIDEAEQDLAEAFVNARTDPTDENQTKVSDVRAQRDSVLLEYNRAIEDLKIVPKAQKKLQQEIRILKSDKEAIINGIVKKKIAPKEASAKKKAIAALAELAAIDCMCGSRSIKSATITGLIEHLGSDTNLTAEMHRHFHDMEKSMKLEEV